MANNDYNGEVITINSDDDDLEVTQYATPTASNRFSGVRHGTDTPIKSESRNLLSSSSSAVKIQPVDSDEEDANDGELAYKKFKERKSLKRKQDAAATRKAKMPRGDPIVGRVKKERPTSQAKRPLKQWGEVSSEDESMENNLPGYLKTRRSQFDQKHEHLKAHGLKLPPTYEDVDFSDDERLEELQERPVFPDNTRKQEYKDIELPYSMGIIPAPIAQWLRQYQVEGVAFLHELFVYQKGGVLGDDMGLGKTIQVIAFLTAAYGKTGDERDAKRMRKMRRSDDNAWYPRTLIVCPGTLIANWRAEFTRWGWWHVDSYHGENKDLALDAAKSGRVEVLITTYTTYMNNKNAVNMIEWDCVIADECHKIKERKSGTTQSMNEINALCRIGLTGTAIQNKYEELWTLLNWTNPGVLGPVSTWKAQISDPLKIGQSHDATLSELSRARRTAKKLVENLLPQFFIRRMKSLIADQLPKKIDRVVFCPLTETQAEAYENFLDSDIVDYIKTSTEPCDCKSGKKAGWCCRSLIPDRDPPNWQSYVFPAINVLQKLSNHLAILIPQGADPKEKQEKDRDYLELALPEQWEDLYRSRDSIVNYANPEFCGKWKVLRKLLKWWHSNGDKVLIFSHSVRLLKMLQMLFHHTSYNVSYLDGSMSLQDRAKAVDEFNADSRQFVFLISTKAGGVGLNITSANKVVVVDPNWNPSYDLQAQDRAYRIGTTSRQIVYARQIYKQQQANIGYNASSERRYFKGVQEKKDQKGEIFGLKNFFGYQNTNIVLRDIVNRTNVAESRAGVEVVDIDLKAEEEGYDYTDRPMKSEDEAMSQLASMICGDEDEKDNKPSANLPTPHKHDPVQAILASAGVEYTHLNNEVIGSSRVEEDLSRRAELAQDDTTGDRQVFMSSQPFSQPAEEPMRFKYHPPEAVIRRQFCSMARRFGFADATEFALVVEGEWIKDEKVPEDMDEDEWIKDEKGPKEESPGP
ncbi:Helicase C-terminal [Penicillium expansum]|nr:Helicase C-terminal [Penicillium expansum]